MSKCFCQGCEVERFRKWRTVLSGIPEEDLFDTGRRTMDLIYEIHNDVASRHPLGIAERLYDVIAEVHIGQRSTAQDLLGELIDDELKSARLNDVPLNEGCVKA